MKKRERVCNTESMDCVSQLPDAILVHILSFLPMKEACRTSILSKHWRCHWLHVDALDFNTCALIKQEDLKPASRWSLDVPALKGSFFKWVNKVLRDRDALVQLNKFRIQFPLALTQQDCHQIDEWVLYAFARKVRSLELDLLRYSDVKCITYNDHKLFGFGTETDWTSLRSLSLSGIQVLKEDIDYFLLKCPFLEHLKVCSSRELASVEICRSSLSLKHLEIIYCYSLVYVSIRDTCLVSLTLTNAKKLVLDNNPYLVSVYVSNWYGRDGSTLQMLSSCLSRLQVLTLNLGYLHNEVFDEIPQLSELKQLALIVAPLQQNVIVRLTSMLSLSPNLKKLVLDLVGRKSEEKIEYEKGVKAPLQHLKHVEVRGYRGEAAEDHLLTHALEHIIAPIKTIIFDPHTLRWDHMYYKKGAEIKSVESRAELLKRLIPSSSIEFMVL